jgi:hypothetical protein
LAETASKYQASYYDWALLVQKAETGEWHIQLQPPGEVAIEGEETFRYEDDAKSEVLALARKFLADLGDSRAALSHVEWIEA